MKKAILLLGLIAGAYANGQVSADTPRTSVFSTTTQLLPLKTDFLYYAKNYEKVFGEFNFTRDANNFGSRNVYVGYNDKLYYQGNSTYVMEMPSNIPVYNFLGYQDVIGGLKNLSSLFTSEKDYSVKQP